LFQTPKKRLGKTGVIATAIVDENLPRHSFNPDWPMQLQQGFVTGEMGFRAQFARQQS
jgi:hypothetical protein